MLHFYQSDNARKQAIQIPGAAFTNYTLPILSSYCWIGQLDPGLAAGDVSAVLVVY